MDNPNPISVRIPHDVKDWLKARSEANCRTVSGEILALLRVAKQTEGTRQTAP